MRTLVTGGAGFIGSTLVDRLLAEGHHVVVIDDFSTGSATNLTRARELAPERLEVHHHDIRGADTAPLVAAARAEVLFHLAAQADVRVSVDDPVRDAEINVIGSLRVIEGARDAGVRKIIFASSGGTIYGDPAPADLPVREDHSQHPVSPYGVAKKVVGDYLAAFERLHGLDWVGLALANVYGPRQDPHGEAGVVAIFAGRLLAGGVCSIFGSGEQTRDFVYVDDVVDAFVRAADVGRGIINIGTAVETSVNELYTTMASAAGVVGDATYAPARAGELDRSSLANAHAFDILGWAPCVSLGDGSARVLDWFRNRPDAVL